MVSARLSSTCTPPLPCTYCIREPHKTPARPTPRKRRTDHQKRATLNHATSTTTTARSFSSQPQIGLFFVTWPPPALDLTNPVLPAAARELRSSRSMIFSCVSFVPLPARLPAFPYSREWPRSTSRLMFRLNLASPTLGAPPHSHIWHSS